MRANGGDAPQLHFAPAVERAMSKVFASEDNWHPLARLMSELSERAFFAGWMDGLEYELWTAVQNGPRTYGQITVDAHTIAQLRELSARCGGGVRFGDSEQEFVPLAEWERLYAARAR